MNIHPQRERRGEKGGRAIRAIALSACLTPLGGLPACGLGGPKNFENENDRLRAEVLEMQRQVRQLEEQLTLRAGELRALRQQAEEGTRPIEDATPPALAAIRLDRYTGTVDTDRDGTDDTLRVYVRPVDGNGRFLVVAGRVSVQLIAAREGRPARTVAEKTFTPAEFDAAYRSGFAGTHYTLELPLPSPLPEDAAGPATVYVTFTEATTGASFTEQRAATIERGTSGQPEAAAG